MALKLVEVRGLDLECKVVQVPECPGVDLQYDSSGEVLTFIILIVANLLFNTESVVPCLQYMPVGSQPREDRHLVHLELLQPHEEVVDVTVFALLEYLAENSG